LANITNLAIKKNIYSLSDSLIIFVVQEFQELIDPLKFSPCGHSPVTCEKSVSQRETIDN